jgi:hypothetical protein
LAIAIPLVYRELVIPPVSTRLNRVRKLGRL